MVQIWHPHEASNTFPHSYTPRPYPYFVKQQTNMHVRLIFFLMVFLARNVVRGRKLLTENVEFYEEYRMDPSTETCTRTRNSAALDALMEELKEAYQFLGMGYTPLQRHKENNDKTMFLEMQAHKRKKSYLTLAP